MAEFNLSRRKFLKDMSIFAASLGVSAMLPFPALLPKPETTQISSGKTEFLFDEGVSEYQRAYITEIMNISRLEMGDAGDVRLYAYKNPPDEGMWKLYPDYGVFAYAGNIHIRIDSLESPLKNPENLVPYPHEYYHMLQYHLADTNYLDDPLWLIEGSAEYKAYRLMDKIGKVRYDAIRKDFKVPAAQAARNPNIPRLGMAMAQEREIFAVGFLKVEMLARIAGGDKSFDRYWRLHRSMTWEKAFHETFRMTPEEFDFLFDNWVKHGYEYTPNNNFLLSGPEKFSPKNE